MPTIVSVVNIKYEDAEAEVKVVDEDLMKSSIIEAVNALKKLQVL